MNLTSNPYFTRMEPYAARAAAALDIPKEVILAQWALESAKGTSGHAKNNNHGGIKYSQYSRTAIKRSDSAFAAYRSLDDFTTDYIRVMKLSYYDKVRAADGIEGTIRALGESPYDAGHYNSGTNMAPGGKLFQFFGVKAPTGGGGSAPAAGRPLTAAEKNEIERKAAAGISLTNPTAEANAYYASLGKGRAVCQACRRPL